MTRPGTIVRMVLFALVLAIVIVPQLVSLRVGRGRLARKIPIWFHGAFLRLFSVRVVQSGAAPTAGEAALVLANHVSWLDILVLGSLRPLSFIAKSEIERWPVIGALAKLQRTVFIDRSRRGSTARVSAIVGHRLAAGELVVLFAEGTTGDGLRVLPFRSSLVGAARAALAAEVGGAGRIRLQPVALAYTQRGGLPLTRVERPEVAWYGDMELAPHLALFFGRGPLDLHVVWGTPIAFEAGTDRKIVTALAEAEVRRCVRDVIAGRPGSAEPEREPQTVAGRGIEAADVSAPGIAAA